MTESIEASGGNADPSTPFYYNASQTAFLLLDYHTFFVDKLGGPAAKTALDTAVRMSAWARSQGILVIHCPLDIHGAPFDTCKDGRGRFQGILKVLQADRGEEAPELQQHGSTDVTYLRKPGHVSALKAPGLEDFLRKQGITSLVLAGLSTSGCVTRTALAASDAEFVVTTLADGCADSDESLHKVVLEKILANRGFVMSADEFQTGFASAHGKV